MIKYHILYLTKETSAILNLEKSKLFYKKREVFKVVKNKKYGGWDALEGNKVSYR